MIKKTYNYLDLSGRKFERLTCVKDVGRTKGHNVLWLCKCECGNETIVAAGRLMSEGTKSCGCLQKERNAIAHTTHSLSRDKDGKRSKLYHVWDGMKQRCLNPNSTFYKDYGGRGIMVCESWMNYPEFHKWAIDNGYGAGLTIERQDVNGGYSPDNCCWASRAQQSRNKRSNRQLTFQGVTRILVEWAGVVGIRQSILSTRLSRGWSVERTLSQPLRRII